MKKIFALVLIVAAVIVCYAPALRDGFVWDDTALILRDPLIRSWRLIAEGFNHFLFTDATASDFYRPIQRLVYTLVYWGFAFHPAPYHLTSLLGHTAAAVALFFFAEELLRVFEIAESKRRWIAFVATFVWAIHPVHSSAVIYVSGLADPLAAMFGFLGCWSILRSLRAKGALPLAWFFASGVAFLLSALSKEIGFVFIALSIFLLVSLRKWSALWKVAMIALLVGATYLCLRNAAEHNPAPSPRAPAPWSIRPLNSARAFAEYSGLIILPLNLHMERQVTAPPLRAPDANLNPAAWRELQSVAGVGLIALTIYWAMRARKRNRLVFTLLVLAAISYLPVCGLWLLNATVAEHWIYIPSAFLFLAATAAIVDLARTRMVFVSLSILAAVWCAFLGVRTFIRTFDWKDQRTFLERTIASGGDSARMLINLSGLELSVGHVDLAKKYSQAAFQKEPDEPMAVINLATIALHENDYKTARELLLRAAQMPVVDARAQELLVILESKEHGQADLMRMRLAARTGPPDWSIERRYVKLLDEAGSTARAIDELRHCLTTEWYRAESWQLLGELLKKAGLPNESELAQAKAYDVHLGEH